jgi:predicted tellurium resistance membrane protein TerC
MSLAIIFLLIGCILKLIEAIPTVSGYIWNLLAWISFTLAAGALLLAGT